MSDDVDLLRRLTEAFNSRDLDTLREFYAPDLAVDAGELWTTGGEVVGVEHVLREFESQFETFEHTEVVADDYIERGGSVVVPSHWRGTVPGSDSVIEQRVFPVYLVRDGRVASIRYFATLAAALAAVDAESPPAQSAD